MGIGKSKSIISEFHVQWLFGISEQPLIKEKELTAHTL